MANSRDELLVRAISRTITRLREQRFPGYGGKKKCAEAFGVHPQVWRDWEKGHRTPGPVYQRKLTEFFNITLSQLRGETDDLTSPDTKIFVQQNTIRELHKQVGELQSVVEKLMGENSELKAVLKHMQSQSVLSMYDTYWGDRV